jgi:hypothetical protein
LSPPEGFLWLGINALPHCKARKSTPATAKIAPTASSSAAASAI